MHKCILVSVAIIGFIVQLASANTILTYTGQNYTTFGITHGPDWYGDATLATMYDKLQPERTSAMALLIQYDLANPLPKVDGWFNPNPNDVMSFQVSDGVRTLVPTVGWFPSFELSGGKIVDWNVLLAQNWEPFNSTGYRFTSSGSGDMAQKEVQFTDNCETFNPTGGRQGDCAVYWIDKATAPPGSWSTVITQPEPSSLSLLVIGLVVGCYQLRKR